MQIWDTPVKTSGGFLVKENMQTGDDVDRIL